MATDSDRPLIALLHASLEEKRGVTIYFPGGSIAGRVTRLTEDAVEAVSQQHDRIAVRLDQVVAVAM